MNPLFGAVICGLALVLIFTLFVALPALLAGWGKVRTVVVVGKGFDVDKSVGDQEEMPEVCERPHVDLLDPLIAPDIEDQPIGLRPSRQYLPAPTLLPSIVSEPATPLVSKGRFMSLTDLIDDVPIEQTKRAKKRVAANKKKIIGTKTNNKLEILNR